MKIIWLTNYKLQFITFSVIPQSERLNDIEPQLLEYSLILELMN